MITQPRVACIGAGNWGKNVVRNFAELGVLSWICELDPERREQLKREHPDISTTNDIQQILTDPTTVGIAIATPAETHAALVRNALSARKHVLVEKPLCLSPADGKDLVSLAEANKLTLM